MNEIPTDSEEMAEEYEEQQETVVVNNCESVSDKVREQHRKQKSANFLDDYDNYSKSRNLDDGQDESDKVSMAYEVIN